MMKTYTIVMIDRESHRFAPFQTQADSAKEAAEQAALCYPETTSVFWLQADARETMRTYLQGFGDWPMQAADFD
jgi:hypothetical protein